MGSGWLVYFSVENARCKRGQGRLLPCSAGPVAHCWFRECGFSLVQVWSGSVSGRGRTPASSPEAHIFASVLGHGEEEGRSRE